MLSVSCINGEQGLTCCTGQTAAVDFSGLLLSDTGFEKVIYAPFDFSQTATGVYVYDTRGNHYNIEVATSTFATIAEVVDFLSGCKANRTKHSYVENFTGNRYTAPWTLAASNIAKRVTVFLGGVKQAYPKRWYKDGNDIVFYIGGEQEELEVFQD